MRPGLGQHTQLKQELKINPRLYQAMDLLYMPLLDLQQHLKQELLNNPFLDMIEPDDGILAIGSGGSYALSAARALVDNTQLEASEIVKRAMHIAGEICIYTNTNISILETT